MDDYHISGTSKSVCIVGKITHDPFTLSGRDLISSFSGPLAEYVQDDADYTFVYDGNAYVATGPCGRRFKID